MCQTPEMPAVELALIEAIVLLDLALLGTDVVTVDVDAMKLQACELFMRNLTTPQQDREKAIELITAAMNLAVATSDTLGRLRPLIVQFVQTQKQSLRERSNAHAMH